MELVSPKDVAQALAVSESSVKRWCDRGTLSMMRTAGGHRRLSVGSVLQFVRGGGHGLSDPSKLGLPADTCANQTSLSDASHRLCHALLDGNQEATRACLFGLYLAGHRLSVIGDHVIAPAMHEIGQQWDCGDVQVYEERRSCETLLNSLRELRSVLPPMPDSAPLAFGCTPFGDPYAIAVATAELSLRENGWDATSLGSSIPVVSLISILESRRPRMIWLSVSYLEDVDRFVTDCAELFEAASAHGTALAVGGQALGVEIRRRMKYSAFCDTFQHLEQFAGTISSLNRFADS